MQAANHHALKSIKKVQNRVLSEHEEKNWDQDHFKHQGFVVVKELHEPNVYQIKPVNGVGSKIT